MTQTVGIFIFDDVELLDFAGPYEVFTCATRVGARIDAAKPAAFRVVTIGQSTAPRRARAGVNVIPATDFANHPPLDVLIVPGGVVTAEMHKPDVIAWLAQTAANCSLTASVCTGAFLLAQAGLLDGREVTTHWEDVDDLRQQFPQVHVQTQQRWVTSGNIVTSGGISAGIDMSLHLVEQLAGRELALRTARQMEYQWNENAASQSVG